MKDFTRIMDLAYIRDGKLFHTGEALMIACLMHVKGKKNRSNEELTEVRRIMRDKNLD